MMKLDFLTDFIPTNITIHHLNEHNCPMPGTVFKERPVIRYEFDFITWGEGHIITDGHDYDALGGRLFIRNPGINVQGIASYHSYYLTFELRDRNGHPYDKPLPFPDYVDFNSNHQMVHFLANMYEAFLLQDPLIDYIKETVLHIIFLELMTTHKNTILAETVSLTIDKTHASIEESRLWLEKNIHTHISLDQLAKKASISPYHYARLFKKLYNSPPMLYLSNLRLLKVKELLLGTDQSIKIIMIESGYNNESNFFKLFKDRVGLTPKQYRDTYKIPYI